MIVVNFVHINFSKWTRFWFHHNIFFFYYNWLTLQVFSTASIGRLHLLCLFQRNGKLVFRIIITHWFLLIRRILNHLFWMTVRQSVVSRFKIRSVRKFVCVYSRTLMRLQFTIWIRNFLFNLNEFVVTAVFKTFFGIIRIVVLKLLLIHKIVFNDIL